VSGLAAPYQTWPSLWRRAPRITITNPGSTIALIWLTTRSRLTQVGDISMQNWFRNVGLPDLTPLPVNLQLKVRDCNNYSSFKRWKSYPGISVNSFPRKQLLKIGA
jgi:hypothetical protein